MYLILFTNRGVNNYEFLKNKSVSQFSFLNTDNNLDKIFKFDFENVENGTSLPYVEHSANFYLFVEQIHANRLSALIEQEVEKIVKSLGLLNVNIASVAEKFTKFVTNWAAGSLGGHYYLTKQQIIYKFVELLLTPYEIDLSWEKFAFYDCPQKQIWNEIVCNKVLTVIDSDDNVLDFLKLYVGSEIKPYSEAHQTWKDAFSDAEQSIFYQQHVGLKKLILRVVGSNGKITPLDIYKCLWLGNKLPLLLDVKTRQDYENVLQILNFSGFKLKVIIVNKTQTTLAFRENVLGQLFTLYDLNDEDKFKILTNFVKL